MQALKTLDAPIVSLFISGRPLWVNKEINASDAFVAAWLPGSEGVAIADVLMADDSGKSRFDFTGKLSFSWPRYVHQTILNRHDEDYDPLFAYGYGLSYQDHSQLSANLPEDGNTFEAGELDDAWLMVSRPMAPWTLTLSDQRGDDIEVTGNRGSSRGKNLTVASIDKLSQEDARQLVWLGDSYSEVAFRAFKPQDLRAYQEEKAALTMDVRIDSAFTDTVYASIVCGDECEGKLPINEQLDRLQPGQWQNISIDLNCFANQGADLSQVYSALTLATKGELGLSIANVKWVPGESDKATKICSTMTTAQATEH